MKKIILLLCFVLCCMNFASCVTGNSNTKTVAVIAKGESHAFWLSVKQGAEDAATEYGYNVSFRGPASESAKDLPGQQEMVQSALSNNVSALVIATIGEGFSDLLSQAYDKGIPVVQFDSGVWENDIVTLEQRGKNPIVSTVSTSNYMAAELAAEHFFEAVKDDISASEEYVIGIIQHDQTQTGIDRVAGFTDRISKLAEEDITTNGKYRIETEVKPGDSDNAYKTALEALYEKDADAIFMSNEGVVKQVYDAILSSGGKYDGMSFCGFDAGTKQIEWMRDTEDFSDLKGAVAQNSYMIGYSAVEQAILASENMDVTETVEINGTWWDKDNVDRMISDNLVYEG